MENATHLDACRLLITKPADGAWNMAVDEVLLGEVAETGTPILRFYTWKRPTLSLGYFQRAEDRLQHPASKSADLVRRLSGGGAILHDRELTYSLILPPTHALARHTQALYQRVHQAIVAVLNTLLSEAHSNWQASLYQAPAVHSPPVEPFLCFQRRTPGDIVVSERSATLDVPNHKVVGSAQRRRQGTVLQHGSILVRKSKRAPELIGFADQLDPKLPIGPDLMRYLAETLPRQLGLKPTTYALSGRLTAMAGELAGTKYGVPSWTERH